MMKKIILILLLSTSFTHAWDSSLFSNSFKLFNNVVTKYDVLEFIKTTHLTDQTHIHLFKKAGGNFEKYSGLISEYSEKNFELGLKQLSYLKLLEADATFSKKVKEWKAFRIDQKKMDKYLDTAELRVIKSFKNTSGDLAAIRKQYGQYLLDSGFPHYEGSDANATYQFWYELFKQRVRTQVWVKEVQKYESYLGWKFERPDPYLEFPGTTSLYKSIAKKINNDVDGQYLTQLQVNNYIQNNPKSKLIIDAIEYYSADFVSIKELKNKDLNSYHRIYKTLKAIRYEDKFDHYLSIAFKFSNKYSIGELNSLISKSKIDFYNADNDYKHLVLGKIYELAINIKTNSIDLKAIKHLVSQLAPNMIKKSHELISNEEKLLRTDKRIEDYTNDELNSYGKSLLKEINQFELKLVGFISWILKFEIKKMTKGSLPFVEVHLKKSDDKDVRLKISNFLKQAKFQSNLTYYIENTMKKYWSSKIQVSKTPGQVMDEKKAWEFIFR